MFASSYVGSTLIAEVKPMAGVNSVFGCSDLLSLNGCHNECVTKGGFNSL